MKIIKKKYLFFIIFVIILFLIYAFFINKIFLKAKLNYLDYKITNNLNSINYCEFDNDCKFDCHAPLFRADMCSQYFLFNNKEDKKMNLITSKIVSYDNLVNKNNNYLKKIGFPFNFNFGKDTPLGLQPYPFDVNIICENKRCILNK